ncbi:BF3164 family lipoprotein [Albibacterium sp.]|uniref:BF3164 family lipoprotein n=1 Tax=Albibacterium sp. TaxID=2952885 RepID=UPI002C052AF7|nr:BF3164 family lipoprotein [Albibacterium sp.]HUH18112.1 BF3164 family lipoprotein [Albibacterium sp.]
MRYLSICIILFFFISSCQSEKTKSSELIDLTQSLSLKGQAINSIDSSCFYDIELVDSMLILVDMCNTNFIYSYDLSTYKPLFSTGIQGKGPNDFVSMPFFSQSDKAKITMSEPTGQAKHFNQISATLNANETVPLGAEFMGSKNIIFSGNRIYGNNTSSGDGIIFYKDNEKINWIEPPNFIKTSAEMGDFKQLLLNNSFVIGGGSDVIAVGMKYYNSIFFS